MSLPRSLRRFDAASGAPFRAVARLESREALGARFDPGVERSPLVATVRLEPLAGNHDGGAALTRGLERLAAGPAGDPAEGRSEHRRTERAGGGTAAGGAAGRRLPIPRRARSPRLDAGMAETGPSAPGAAAGDRLAAILEEHAPGIEGAASGSRLGAEHGNGGAAPSGLGSPPVSGGLRGKGAGSPFAGPRGAGAGAPAAGPRGMLSGAGRAGLLGAGASEIGAGAGRAGLTGVSVPTSPVGGPGTGLAGAQSGAGAAGAPGPLFLHDLAAHTPVLWAEPDAFLEALLAGVGADSEGAGRPGTANGKAGAAGDLHRLVRGSGAEEGRSPLGPASSRGGRALPPPALGGPDYGLPRIGGLRGLAALAEALEAGPAAPPARETPVVAPSPLDRRSGPQGADEPFGLRSELGALPSGDDFDLPSDLASSGGLEAALDRALRRAARRHGIEVLEP